MADKIYLNKFTSVKSSEYGFGIYIKDVNALYEELKANANEDGSIRVYVSKKQTPDKFGNDGTVTLNTWKPNNTTASQNRVAVQNTQAQVYAPTPQNLNNTTAPAPVSADDLPF